jgi:hypothetical protein
VASFGLSRVAGYLTFVSWPITPAGWW